MDTGTAKYTLRQLDENWVAVHQATLLFVLDDNNILLIRKKRGLGEGKINGPGGKLDAGETFVDCAVREVQEELGITAINPQPRGRLRFQFCDGYSIDVQIFVASQYSGTPVETDEAIPLWFKLAEIPYEEMWEDDEIWLPAILNDQQVDGRFIFDGDKMLEHEVSLL